MPSPSFLFPEPLPWFWLYQLHRLLAPSLQHTLQCIHLCSHLHHLSLKDTSLPVAVALPKATDHLYQRLYFQGESLLTQASHWGSEDLGQDGAWLLAQLSAN